MKVSEFLAKAKTLIADPKHWTQGFYAQDAQGQAVGPAQPHAVCWCSVGVLSKVAHEENAYDARFAAARCLFDVSEECGYDGVTDFNDNSSHETVMKAWDKAIKLAKEDEDENR